MNADAIRIRKPGQEHGQVFKLTLEATGPDDSLFLTRLYKALLLNDEIEIDLGGGKVMAYKSCADMSVIEQLEWENVSPDKETTD
jgi:hypothetical protein